MLTKKKKKSSLPNINCTELACLYLKLRYQFDLEEELLKELKAAHLNPICPNADLIQSVGAGLLKEDCQNASEESANIIEMFNCLDLIVT